jgi:hypothetical protein
VQAVKGATEATPATDKVNETGDTDDRNEQGRTVVKINADKQILAKVGETVKKAESNEMAPSYKVALESLKKSTRVTGKIMVEKKKPIAVATIRKFAADGLGKWIDVSWSSPGEDTTHQWIGRLGDGEARWTSQRKGKRIALRLRHSCLTGTCAPRAKLPLMLRLARNDHRHWANRWAAIALHHGNQYPYQRIFGVTLYKRKQCCYRPLLPYRRRLLLLPRRNHRPHRRLPPARHLVPLRCVRP